ncbi:hypothetical protein ACYJW8_10685 [Frateuria aurantia]
MAAGLAGLVLLLFAGLFPLGHWYSDEYDIFHDMALRGSGAAWHRFWHWSPRPVSEALIYLYGRVVLATGQAWISLVLLLPMLLLLAAALGPLYRVPGKTGRGWMVLLAVVCALCLVGHPVARVFYWPVAALAYVPTLAGVMGVFAESLREEPSMRPWARGGWLLLAALSSEIGAMFALVYGLLNQLVARRLRWSLLPAMLGAGLVVALTVLHRGGGISEQMAGGGPVHDLFGSFKTSLVALWPNLWFSTATTGGLGAALQTFSKLALALGAAGLAIGEAPSSAMRRELLSLALATAAMVPATIFAAQYQFGQLCCEHHDIVRQCFMVVSMAALGVAAAVTWPAVPRLGRFGPWMLSLAILAALAISVRPLWADYRGYGQRYQLQRDNWQSGMADSRVLRVRQQWPGQLVGGPPVLPAGSYGGGVPVPPALRHQIRFFDKQSVRVSAPEPAVSAAP